MGRKSEQQEARAARLLHGLGSVGFLEELRQTTEHNGAPLTTAGGVADHPYGEAWRCDSWKRMEGDVGERRARPGVLCRHCRS